MATELTKDADKLVCLIYKEYLSRRKYGLAKRQAKDFVEENDWPDSFAKEFNEDDMLDTLRELKSAGFVKQYIHGGFTLEDACIIYMENRFPNGLSQVLDWLGKIKGAIPFA